MNEREQFIILVDNEPLKKANAIILLEGDGFSRIPKAKEFFEEGWANIIVISGGSDNPSYGSFPARKIANILSKQGIARKHLIIEESSKDTREQAIEVMHMVRKRKWKKILLVASPHHQYRAFLTFLKVMKEAGQQIQIINAPPRDLSWFKKKPWGRRIELLTKEFEKIEAYKAKGHIASFAEAIAYQKWKEYQH